MSMYDTFYLCDKGRTLAVQSKAFVKALNEYRLGDFVLFDQPTPLGITAYIEDFNENNSDASCPVEWAVLLLVDGCFLDSYVAPSQSEAQQAADAMAKLWTVPERQLEAFKLHARDHYDARCKQHQALGLVFRLLRDYDAWQQKKTDGTQTGFGFMQHDFDKEDWDFALARRLAEIPEYATLMPTKYRVALILEDGQGLGKGGE